jgi:ABC-type transport system involved in multi-copper enzyme maturation permease subunit
MMTAMIRRLLQRGLAGALMLLLGVMIFQFVNPIIADSIGGEEGLSQLIELLPPGLQTLAQISPDFIALTGLAGYLSLGYDHPVYLVLVMSAIIGFTSRSIAGEIDRGTLALTLSRPIPRTNIYLARVAGLLVLIAVFAGAGPLATWLGLAMAQPTGEVSADQLLALALLCGLLAWAVGGLSLMVSAASGTTGRVVGWATGFLVISFFVDYFAELWDMLEPVKPFSIFWYFDTTNTVVDGSVPMMSVLVLGGSGLLGVIAGWWKFTRRDFEI